MNSDVRHLTILVRHVASGNGAWDELSVDCPRRAKRVYVDECASCGLGGGIVLASDTRDSFVRCRAHGPSDVRKEVELPDPARSLGETRVREVMTRPVVSVRPDASLGSIRWLLLRRRIGAVPVVTDEGTVIGIVSKTDVVQADEEVSGTTVEEDLPGGYQAVESGEPMARDVMTPAVFTLSPDASLGLAAALMAHERVHRVPVVDGQGALVGILSALDVLGWLARREGYVVARPAPEPG